MPFFRYRYLKLVSKVGTIAVLWAFVALPCAFGSGKVMAAVEASSMAAANGPTISISGSLTAGSNLSVGIEGSGPNADFTVVFTFNGFRLLPDLTWNREKGTWDFEFHLPWGSGGSTGQVTVVTGNGTASTSFSVG